MVMEVYRVDRVTCVEQIREIDQTYIPHWSSLSHPSNLISYRSDLPHRSSLPHPNLLGSAKVYHSDHVYRSHQMFHIYQIWHAGLIYHIDRSHLPRWSNLRWPHRPTYGTTPIKKICYTWSVQSIPYRLICHIDHIYPIDQLNTISIKFTTSIH